MKRKRSAVKIIAPLIILIASAAFFYKMISTKPAPKITTAKEITWNVQAVPATIAEHSPAIRLYAKLMSHADIKLSSSIDADVARRLVNAGEHIVKNQLLIQLDKTNTQQLYQQRTAEYEEIQADIKDEMLRFNTDKTLIKQEKAILLIATSAVERAKTLEKSEMASSSQLDDANRNALQQQLTIAQRESSINNHPNRLAKLKARLAKAEAQLLIARDELTKTEIRSPVNGYVRTVDVNQAEHVRPGNILVQVFDSENIELQALIPEYYIRFFRQSINNKKPFTGYALNGSQQISITLDRISGNINPGQAGSFAYFRILQAEETFNVGQSIELFVKLEKIPDSISLPATALYGTDANFKILQDRLQRVKIEWFGNTLPENNKTRIIVKSRDIHKNDLILTSKFANAMQGLKVTINTADNTHSK